MRPPPLRTLYPLSTRVDLGDPPRDIGGELASFRRDPPPAAKDSRQPAVLTYSDESDRDEEDTLGYRECYGVAGADT